MSQSASPSSSSSSSRHSTRTSHPPLTLAEEQAAEALSQLEQRDLDAALRLSLTSYWESDDEKAAEAAVITEESSDEEKEEVYLTPAAMRVEETWTEKITPVDIPLPRLRTSHQPHSNEDLSPFQLLQLFLPQNLMEEFAAHTNAAAGIDWPATTASELYAFIGAQLFMSIDRLPRREMYWSESFSHSTTLLTSVFSRDRFKQLLSFFRVAAVDGRRCC